MTPGATAVTRISSRDSRGARLLTNPDTPYLLAMYCIEGLSHSFLLQFFIILTHKRSDRISNLTRNTAHMQDIASFFLLQEMSDC